MVAASERQGRGPVQGRQEGPRGFGGLRGCLPAPTGRGLFEGKGRVVGGEGR